MRIIVIGAEGLGPALAAHLNLEYVHRLDEIASDGFVFDGTSLSTRDARALDDVLRARAAEVDAVLWVSGGDPAVIGHYGGRVIELDPTGEIFEPALEALREMMLAA